MDVTYFVYGFILLCVAVMGAYRLDVEGAEENVPTKMRWWDNFAAPWEGEGFQAAPPPPSAGNEKDASPLMEYPPGKPAPVDLYNKTPYHLLADRLPPVAEGNDTLSCVTSRSCYAVDGEAYLSRVGNYRQLTNNYKHDYPDSCSAPRQELVLGFYEANPLSVSR